MGRMSLRKIHRYKTNNMNIVELIKECPKYTKLYTITHGEVYSIMLRTITLL